MLDPGQDPSSNLHRRPVYLQLRDTYLERIRTGEWRPRQALPNEVDLAGASHVSVGTIRKAMDELAAMGVLTRQQGRGTFVSEFTFGCGLFDPIRNADGSSVQWDPPRQLEAKIDGLTPNEAKRLNRPKGSCDALRLAWLHSRNNKAFSLQRSIVPLDTGIDVKRARHNQGLNDLFGVARILVVRSEDRLTIAVPDQEAAKHLKVSDDRPLQHVSRRYFDARETIVGLCSSWLNVQDEQYVCTQARR